MGLAEQRTMHFQGELRKAADDAGRGGDGPGGTRGTSTKCGGSSPGTLPPSASHVLQILLVGQLVIVGVILVQGHHLLQAWARWAALPWPERQLEQERSRSLKGLLGNVGNPELTVKLLYTYGHTNTNKVLLAPYACLGPVAENLLKLQAQERSIPRTEK
ncbi:hypothetical protein VDGL01_07740 [Verticillium dahliae]